MEALNSVVNFLGSEFGALATVILIDLVLAGDNAIVVGMAAAGLEPTLRKRAVILGIGAAALLRIVFALFTTQLLAIIGLTLAGGILLLWVCWKLWREIRHQKQMKVGAELAESHGASTTPTTPKTFGQALTQIVIADVSMSLDNVLAVAGSARQHLWVLIVGLALSVALMGVAASMIAGVLKRFPWISYVGLALIVYVALNMIYHGTHEVVEQLSLAGEH
jgi:YjbE family integral membrane protein